MNVTFKNGEVESILDLLNAIARKGQWLKKLEKDKSEHVPYFPGALDKTIAMFSEALISDTEPFD